MKKPVFAANWKMNFGPQETRAYLKTFLDAFPKTDDRTVIIFPSAISLVVAGFALRDRPEIALLLNEFGHERGPSGLVRRTEPGASVGVEIFVKQITVRGASRTGVGRGVS